MKNRDSRLVPVSAEALLGLRKFVERFVQPTEAEYAPLFARVVVEHFAPRAEVARSLESGGQVYLVLAGVARQAYTAAGREHTIAFSRPGDLLLDMAGCFSRQSGQTTLVAATPLRLVRIGGPQLRELSRAHAVWARCGQLVTESYLLHFRQRALSLQLMPALARYEELLRTHAELFNQVPLHQLASYLGIARETLSRLRRP